MKQENALKKLEAMRDKAAGNRHNVFFGGLDNEPEEEPYISNLTPEEQRIVSFEEGRISALNEAIKITKSIRGYPDSSGCIFEHDHIRHPEDCEFNSI